MTNYIKFVPQITNYFNVTPQYVFDVYRQVQITESTIWLNMILTWCIITFTFSIIFGLINLSESKEKKFTKFIDGCVVGLILVGGIIFVVCFIYGNLVIQLAQPEYMTWITYIETLSRGF